ncbi:MAG: bifunctional glutamate N-acetyltransferase/amino-acid acetyltransferase ArgJ [Candidatus Omnitrophica bacterium]|nr:bifunctional glutamate N-acetyltransferase/amino-acid acetyltransferase ArgJ [Candidatus Omnitrophota bacterium]
MKIYHSALLPRGFLAYGLASGIKRSAKLDLALFYSEVPAKVSARFTSNKIQSASIKLCKHLIRKNKTGFRAIVVNSGNANCFTGKAGILDAKQIANDIAKFLEIKEETVLVASTGIIGKRLPLAKIKQALPRLTRGLSKEGIDKAKRAIMTTDTFTKEITVRLNVGFRPITLCGVAKGAGMVAPHLATMLCFIFTDANITQRALDMALDIAVDNSFHCITVDGCMSTNDMVSIMANGVSANPLIDVNKNFSLFTRAVEVICINLAKMIIQDAEGASKFICIKVDKAKNFTEAKRIALSIANSNLVKIALFAGSPNVFGRVVASLGASGIDLKEDKVKIKLSPLDKNNINILVSVGRGDASCVVYTSDLTPQYIKINAEYN